MAEMTLEQFAAWADGKAKKIDRPDFTEALKKILVALTAGVIREFDAAEGPDGEPWRQLELAFRRPLIGKHGQMMRRVIAAHENGDIQPTMLTVTVDSDVAALHNFGLKKRTQREFLGFGEEMLTRAEGIVADSAAEKLLEI